MADGAAISALAHGALRLPVRIDRRFCKAPEMFSALAGHSFVGQTVASKPRRTHEEKTMNIKSLFSRKSKTMVAPQQIERRGSSAKLDVDALDTCVGGRGPTDGVGCYMQGDQSQVH